MPKKKIKKDDGKERYLLFDKNENDIWMFKTKQELEEQISQWLVDGDINIIRTYFKNGAYQVFKGKPIHIGIKESKELVTIKEGK
jgi:hypothetical protein